MSRVVPVAIARPVIILGLLQSLAGERLSWRAGGSCHLGVTVNIVATRCMVSESVKCSHSLISQALTRRAQTRQTRSVWVQG